MILELSDKAICDEMMALTALRCVVRNAEGCSSQVLITADQLPGMRNMVRMMFAETVMELHALVDDCSMDDEDRDLNQPYDNSADKLRLKVELRGEWPSGKALAIKRQWEHIVAAKVLEAIATDRDGAFARNLRAQWTGAEEALHSLAGSVDNRPGTIEGRWW